MANVVSLGSTKGYSLNRGSETAVVFFHGVPFNASLWLPVIECLDLPHSLYALDLKGFGFSADDINLKDFSLAAQLDWLEAQVKDIPAEKLVFVMHGWSSVPATLLAQRIASRIKGLAYFEAQLKAVASPDKLSLPMQTVAQHLLDKDDLVTWVMQDNGYPELLFPLSTIGCLSSLKQQFAQQFESEHCRKAILQYLYELPLGFKRSSIVEQIEMNSAFLQRSKFDKCVFYATPGLMTTIETVSWVKHNVDNVSLIDIGHALHCAPITIPKVFSKELTSWINAIDSLVL